MSYKVEKLSDYKYYPQLYEDNPKHYTWFFKNHLPQISTGNREILFIRHYNNMCGVAFLKKTIEEKKICTFYVAEHGRNIGIGRALMQASFDYLETDKPLITMPSEKVIYFLAYMYKYNWKINQIIDGYYVKNIDEVVFNGFLDKKS